MMNLKISQLNELDWLMEKQSKEGHLMAEAAEGEVWRPQPHVLDDSLLLWTHTASQSQSVCCGQRISQ